MFTCRALITVGIVTAVALLLALLWAGVNVFLLIFAGVLLAILLDGLSGWLSQHTPLARGWALSVVTLGLLGLIGGSIWLLAPSVGAQVDELTRVRP